VRFEKPYEPDFSQRDPAEGVESTIYKRWSPRSLKKVEIPEDILTAIIDAARWSPSCFNEQPWLFMTSSNQEEFDLYLSLLVERNQQWAKNASVLGFFLCRRKFTGRDNDNRWGKFDTGAAWMAMTMQANQLGLYTHAMAGVKFPEVYKQLEIPEDDFEVICGFAIGALDTPDKLPLEDFIEGEVPSGRKPLSDFWFRGKFSK
jgi:nitroreductase